MLAALLCVAFWSTSSLLSARAGKRLGGIPANRWRLVLAVALLSGWAWHAGYHRDGPVLWWMLASGVVGLGLGDIAMFAAYARLGVRLTVLVNQCSAVILAALVEWRWLGDVMPVREMFFAGAVLTGMVVALAPGASSGARQERRVALRTRLAGIVLALIAASGTAVAAVMTRQAVGIAAADHHAFTGPQGGAEMAWLRCAGGAGFMLLLMPLAALMRRILGSAPPQRPDWRRGWYWLVGTAILGPTLGVVCFQWALSQHHAGTVQAVVATIPVVVMPLAWIADGDRPRLLSILGAVLAVLGAVGMAVR